MTTINGTLASAPTTSGGAIPRPRRTRRKTVLTFADAVDRVLRIEEINPSESRAVERAVLAVQAARRSFTSYSSQGFRYYDGRAHVTFGANVALGSVTVASNVITPATAPSWPTWMELAQIRVADKTYPVLAYTSTTATVEGLPNGTYTTAQLQQGFARLPADFRRRGSITDGANTYPIVDVPTGVLRSWEDYYEWANSSANPLVFGAIAGDQRFHGELMLSVWPTYPSQTTVSIFYERYPAELDYHRVGAGTVTTSGTTVTASESIFTDEMIGCAIVFSTGAGTEIRSSLASRDLVSAQRIITDVASGTVATMDASITGNLTDKGYYISDVVDVMPGAMQDAFLRLCEYEFSRSSKSKFSEKRFVEFRQQMDIAMADDSRYRSSVDDNPYEGWGYGVGDVTGRPDL